MNIPIWNFFVLSGHYRLGLTKLVKPSLACYHSISYYFRKASAPSLVVWIVVEQHCRTATTRKKRVHNSQHLVCSIWLVHGSCDIFIEQQMNVLSISATVTLLFSRQLDSLFDFVVLLLIVIPLSTFHLVLLYFYPISISSSH